MWALPDGECFSDPGHRRYAAAHATSGQTPQPVIVSEDTDGSYWGWIPAEGGEPRLIYRHAGMFSMCFLYGPQAEQDAGRGRIVRLNITAFADG